MLKNYDELVIQGMNIVFVDLWKHKLQKVKNHGPMGLSTKVVRVADLEFFSCTILGVGFSLSDAARCTRSHTCTQRWLVKTSIYIRAGSLVH